MRKTIRLTETDLTNIVKRVIEEQTNKSSFTFGDKIKNKITQFMHGDGNTDDEMKLADELVKNIENGNFKNGNLFGGDKSGVGYLKVRMDDGVYFLLPWLNKGGMHGAGTPFTVIKTPEGGEFRITSKRFTTNLLKYIDSDKINQQKS